MSHRDGKNKRDTKTVVREARYSIRRRQASHPKHATNGHCAKVREEPVPYNVQVLASRPFTTLDLFCGAGGITEGFHRAGFDCLYANDINHWAIETFRANHPTTHADNRPIEQVDAAALRRELKLERGELDVIVGGPPCQGFSINAPERFLADPRSSLFKHYIRFLDEFEPKAFLIENSRRIQPLLPR